MEATGKIFKMLPEQNGEGRNGRWVKQDFVIETDEQFPKKICFSLWGEEKVAALKQLALGDKVVVNFNAESREFNDRWYTDLRCWKLDKQVTQNIARPSSNPNTGGGGEYNQASSSTNENTVPDESFGNTFQADDDLPF